jgi:hypothetical protein
MKIFVSHSSDFDYKNELYLPLRNSFLNKKYDFYLPYEKDPVNTKEIIQKSDLMIAEASYPSSGQGIEFVWAYEAKIPIICIYRISSKISDSLKNAADEFIEYENTDDLLRKLSIALVRLKK